MDRIAQLIAVLDGMPDALRGLLSALLLLLLLIAFDVWVRRGRDLPAPELHDDSVRAGWRRLRLSFQGHRWRIAHTKTSLLALALIPLGSTALASLRLPFFVEALPAGQSFNHWWLHGPLLAWLLVALVVMLRQGYRWRQAARSTAPDAAPVTDAINKRALHWQRRLGITGEIAVRVGAITAPASARWPERVITLPRAALHWPAAAADVALIQQLCHFALVHHRWQLVAALVGALYWPFRFVREVLPGRLQADFALAAAELAEACYRDPLGYRRATKALQERLDSAPVGLSGTSVEAALRHPDPNDPYGRVFLVFVQALLVVYVLTGATLREIPDDSNFRYAEFVDDWYESFTRSIKYAPEPVAGDSRDSRRARSAGAPDGQARPAADAPSRPAAPAAPPAALPER